VGNPSTPCENHGNLLLTVAVVGTSRICD